MVLYLYYLVFFTSRGEKYQIKGENPCDA